MARYADRMRRRNIFNRPQPGIPKRWAWGSTEWEACALQLSAAVIFEQYRSAYDKGEWRDARYYQALAADKYREARVRLGIEP